MMAENMAGNMAEKDIKAATDAVATDADHELVNASGHIQEVDRNFGLLSLSAYGITNGNVWAVLGGTILVAISNGGPPGTIYE